MVVPFTAPGPIRAHRIATACKGAYGAIRAIANSPATPNAWLPRAVLTPVAGSIPAMLSRARGVAIIDADTERQRSTVAPDIEQRFRCYDGPVDFLKLWETTPALPAAASRARLPTSSTGCWRIEVAICQKVWPQSVEGLRPSDLQRIDGEADTQRFKLKNPSQGKVS